MGTRKMANKKRLIDADAVMRKINAFAASIVFRGSNLMFTGKDSCNPHEYTRGYEQGVLDVQKILGGQPIVDAVEVVRCLKCRYRSQYSDDNGMYKCGGFQAGNGDAVAMVKPDFFCAYGERKDNG